MKSYVQLDMTWLLCKDGILFINMHNPDVAS